MGEMATHVAAAAGHVEVLEESCLADNGISVARVSKISGAGVTMRKKQAGVRKLADFLFLSHRFGLC